MSRRRQQHREEEYSFEEELKVDLWREMGKHGRRRITGIPLAADLRRRTFEIRIINELGLEDNPRWQQVRRQSYELWTRFKAENADRLRRNGVRDEGPPSEACPSSMFPTYEERKAIVEKRDPGYFDRRWAAFRH
ncbi:unnamed protein product [Oikopleura dioica]|uniref:Uncharacterized protein n=1 Tax=Oikopleura dioica TaxID=34765 RepID=E4X8Z7_OIKDI|nr:unnamed protein product [Oikopleura dioica]